MLHAARYCRQSGQTVTIHVIDQSSVTVRSDRMKLGQLSCRMVTQWLQETSCSSGNCCSFSSGNSDLHTHAHSALLLRHGHKACLVISDGVADMPHFYEISAWILSLWGFFLTPVAQNRTEKRVIFHLMLRFIRHEPTCSPQLCFEIKGILHLKLLRWASNTACRLEKFVRGQQLSVRTDSSIDSG